MFAIASAVDHASRGVDTGRGSLPGANSCVFFFTKKQSHVEVFTTVKSQGLSTGDYFIATIGNMLQLYITCLVFS